MISPFHSETACGTVKSHGVDTLQAVRTLWTQTASSLAMLPSFTTLHIVRSEVAKLSGRHGRVERSQDLVSKQIFR